jgi:TPR repeat protein
MQGLAAGFWWINVLLCAYCTFYWSRNRMNDGTPGLMTPGGQVWAWQLVFCFIVLVLDVSPWHLFWLGIVSLVLSVIVSNVWRGRMLAARYPDIGSIEVQQNDSRTSSLSVVTQIPATTQVAGISSSLLAKASAGDATSQRLVAEAYKEGRGVSKDNTEAYVWYRKAATGGDAESQSQTGFLYYVNYKIQGDAEDGLQAELWLRKAAEQEHTFAQRHLASMYETGTGVPQDYAKAVYWYSKAAELGDSAAQLRLGELIKAGHGAIKDFTQSSPSSTPTIAPTVTPAVSKTVKRKQVAAPPKVIVPQESGMADYWYQKALLLTDESQYLECLQCLERAVDADPSHVQSLYGIAHHYQHGYGVNEDLPTAAKWFREAAERGFSPAQDKLGLMYEHGMGVAKNWREAAKWYLIAAENGFSDSQYHLGVIYANGQGFPIDFKASVKWCIKAAEQGHSEAQSTLGRIYLQGVDGIPRDAAEASKWLRKAADQGDAESQFDLGYLFEQGDGVLQDLEEAARYYSLSAEQGYADGQRGVQRINLILGRHSISMERLPNEEDWQYQMRRMVEQTRFVPLKKQ